MDVTVTFADSDVILALKVNKDMTVNDFRNHALEEAGYGTGDALLFYQDERLSPDSTLAAAGIKDNDIVMIVRPSAGDAPRGPGRQAAPTGVDPSRDDAIERAREQILYNPDLFKDISERLPELANSLHNPDDFRTAYNRYYEQSAGWLRNPDSEEAQLKIMEHVKQQAIDENLATALEEMPEAFAQVIMLYTQVEVNGQPVKAFVDSGAQATIISPECAERTGVSHLIDKRHRGTAVGVGQANILGRIHMVPIKVGSSFFPCAFTVIEGIGMDMLLGLDMLKHHQAIIDLRKNALVMGHEEVPFLGEADIPKTKVGNPAAAQTPQGAGAAAAAANTNPFSRGGQALGSSAGSSAGPSSSTSRPGAAAQARAAPRSGAGATAGPPAGPPPQYPEHVIENLIALGFSRDEAIAALRRTNGNAEMAASLLFGG